MLLSSTGPKATGRREVRARLLSWTNERKISKYPLEKIRGMCSYSPSSFWVEFSGNKMSIY